MTVRNGILWMAVAGALLLAGRPMIAATKRAVAAARAEQIWREAQANDRPEPRRGEPVLWLSVPSVDLRLPALQGVTEDRLEKFPCKVAWPGEARLTVILGHRDTHFRPLERLERGRRSKSPGAMDGRVTIASPK